MPILAREDGESQVGDIVLAGSTLRSESLQ